MALRNQNPQYPISTAVERTIGGALRRVFARVARRGGYGCQALYYAGFDMGRLEARR